MVDLSEECMSKLVARFETKFTEKTGPQMTELLNNQKQMMETLIPLRKRLSAVEKFAAASYDATRATIVEARHAWHQREIVQNIFRGQEAVVLKPVRDDPGFVIPKCDAIVAFLEGKGLKEYEVMPLGDKGFFKIIPFTRSEMTTRKMSAKVLLLKNDLLAKFHLSPTHERPLPLRRHNDFIYQFSKRFKDVYKKQADLLSYKRGVLLMGDKNICPDFLIPESEAFWDDAYKIILEGHRSKTFEDCPGKGNMYGAMCDLYVFSKGVKPLEYFHKPADVEMK